MLLLYLPTPYFFSFPPFIPSPLPSLSLSFEYQMLDYPPHYTLCHFKRLTQVYFFDAPKTIIVCWYAFTRASAKPAYACFYR